MTELTQAARKAIANTAAITSRQAGVVAAGATAVAAGASPQIKPFAGSVAVGATAIGIAADAVEQLARPDTGQVVLDSVGTGAAILIQRIPGGALAAPLTNEAVELIKETKTVKEMNDRINRAAEGLTGVER